MPLFSLFYISRTVTHQEPSSLHMAVKSKTASNLQAKDIGAFGTISERIVPDRTSYHQVLATVHHYMFDGQVYHIHHSIQWHHRRILRLMHILHMHLFICHVTTLISLVTSFPTSIQAKWHRVTKGGGHVWMERITSRYFGS
jgi:hypothetical protein